MDLLLKAILISALFVLIYWWNKFVPNFIVKSGSNFHRKFNKKNLNRQPIQFVLTNEENIIKFYKSFLGIAFALWAYFILSMDLSKFL